MRLFNPEHDALMSMLYGEGREQYAELLRGLAKVLEGEVLPLSPQFDRKTGGIAKARRALFESGVCRMPFPKRYGGMELPFGVYSLAMELVGAADAGTAMSMAIHNTAAEGIYRFGSEGQREGVFADLIAGKRLASFALTEPSSGSDAKSMRTVAVKRGSEYVINGSKMFITNAGEADVYLLFTGAEKGHDAFVVDSSTPGLSVGEDIQKLGMRGSRTSEVRFEECRVPEENLVGAEGEAFEYVKALLSGSRIIMGSICVGIATQAYAKALEYSRQRRLFERPLSDFQLSREKIADMKTEMNAARLLCAYAARLREMDMDYASEAAQGKVLATEMATRVCDQAIQMLGGYGYTNDDVHRHWRDARLLTIGEGTSEVLRMLIAAKELARAR